MGYIKYFKSKAEEIEAQGFKLISYSSEVCIENHNGVMLSIYKPRGIKKDQTFLYLDCMLHHGIERFIREWKDLDKLYDYIMKICLPTIKYLGGETTQNVPELMNQIECILKDRKIDYTYLPKLKIGERECHMYTDYFVKTVYLDCSLYYFDSGKKRFGVYIYGVFFRLAELDKDFNILTRFPWYHFCPVYINGNEYVKTTINNFLDFVENIDKYSFEKE